MKKNKRKKKRLPLSYKAFGFPAHITSKGVNLSIYENIGASIENYGSIEEYTSQCLCLKTRSGHLKICGTELIISETDADNMVISGKINSVTFDYANCCC